MRRKKTSYGSGEKITLRKARKEKLTSTCAERSTDRPRILLPKQLEAQGILILPLSLAFYNLFQLFE